MKSNYKLLGDYIQEVNVRNTDLKDLDLLGISIEKEFIPSIANTIGTDMSKYKIVKKNQFAYGTVTSRNGDKISIALLKGNEEALISQAYISFEIIDENKLLPEYLMMWFRRPEFDRYARYMSYGSAREVFSWEEMCNVKLPVPSIEKQKEIVKEYNTILSRIQLNEKMLYKLEELSQSIYKQHFVNFEPYKNQNMVYNEDFNQYIPDTWDVICVKDYCIEMKSGGTPSRSNESFWNSKDIHWLKTGEIFNNIIIDTEEYISENGLNSSSAKILPKGAVLMSMYGVNAGQLGILKIESSTNQACCAMICSDDKEAAYLYHTLLYNQDEISRQSIGGAQENLSKNFIENIKIIKPCKEIIDSLNLDKIIHYRELITKEIKLENEMLDILLSKLTNMGE
jgi:type I restriction enzyme S subunit